MFRNRCAGCHGPAAQGYLGPDLTGFWAAGGADDRMFDIVRRGVPGTEMPPADPQRVPDRDIWQMLAYVRALGAVPAAPPTGDAENGERIFRTNCTSCHIVNGRGGQLGRTSRESDRLDRAPGCSASFAARATSSGRDTRNR
jgi:ubiquinol-cytochrome c reductase cytochrome c subunit